jgi:hypothetical protein
MPGDWTKGRGSPKWVTPLSLGRSSGLSSRALAPSHVTNWIAQVALSPFVVCIPISNAIGRSICGGPKGEGKWHCVVS